MILSSTLSLGTLGRALLPKIYERTLENMLLRTLERTLSLRTLQRVQTRRNLQENLTMRILQRKQSLRNLRGNLSLRKQDPQELVFQRIQHCRSLEASSIFIQKPTLFCDLFFLIKRLNLVETSRIICERMVYPKYFEKEF